MEIKLRFYIQLTCKPYTSSTGWLLYGPRLFLRLPFVFASALSFSLWGKSPYGIDNNAKPYCKQSVHRHKAFLGTHKS